MNFVIKHSSFVPFLGLGLTLALMVACSEETVPQSHSHAHVAPHGGCLVMLGEHAAQLELVLEDDRVSLFILDGGAERFVRITQKSISGELNGQRVRFDALSNAATGETVGDTAHFGAVWDRQESVARFPVSIDEIVIRGQTFSAVVFQYPEGKH